MAGQVVQMDYAVIGEVSKGFGTARDVLNTVGKVLEVLVGILRATAFFSFGTSAALAQYLDTIKQKVLNLAKICQEFSDDLAQAINDHKSGDIQGKQYFGKGITL
jgi:hypothetical protein